MSNPSTPLTDAQLKLLADRLFEAATENAERGKSPPDPTETGEFVAAQAANYGKASLSYTQALMTVLNRSRR